MFKIEISEAFGIDVDTAVNFIFDDNPNVSERFSKELKKRLSTISNQPNIGRSIILRKNNFSYTIRKIFHYDYIVYYHVSEKNETIYMLRFVHGAMNQADVIRSIRIEELG